MFERATFTGVKFRIVPVPQLFMAPSEAQSTSPFVFVHFCVQHNFQCVFDIDLCASYLLGLEVSQFTNHQFVVRFR